MISHVEQRSSRRESRGWFSFFVQGSTSSPSRPKNCKKNKKKEKRQVTDITSTKKAAAEISCSAARASIRGMCTRSRRAHSSPCLRYKLQACTAHAFTRNVGMHCACVYTNSNLMRGFVANPPSPSPPPPPPPPVSSLFTIFLAFPPRSSH